MICSHFHHFLIFFAAFFFPFQLVSATRFSFAETEVLFIPSPTTDKPRSQYIPVSSLDNQVFGLSRDGRVAASIKFFLNVTDPPCPARLSLCQVSDAFVRGPNYQRRQTRRKRVALIESFASIACQSDQLVTPQERDNIQDPDTGLAWCISRNLCPDTTAYTFGAQQDSLQPNEMYLLGLALCYANFSATQYLNVTTNGDVEFRNPDLPFPQLGFEEVLFPIFSASIIVLLGVPFLLFSAALPFAWRRRMPIRYTAQFVVAAIFLKLLGAILTFVHFYTLAQTGARQRWYLYVRLLLASSADILFIIAFISISSGYAVMPNSWFVEDRSPIFLVYIGVVLQLLITIAVKVMFPFQYLGAITYTLAGTAIALIASISSYRNSRFLQRFGHLIESAHIYLKSTPIRQLRRFYVFNIGIVAVAYITKIISVGLFDYQFNRPDLLWGSMETVDAVLLIWFAAFIFPRPKSALYVDMSNLNNERLHQAERWRARQLSRQASNATVPSNSSEELPPPPRDARNELSSPETPDSDDTSAQSSAHPGTAQPRLTRLTQRFLRRDRRQQSHVRFAAQGNAASEALDFAGESVGAALDPQPPWIAWTSGDSLPRPTSYTWRGGRRESRIVRREGATTPFLRVPIVVGSAEGTFDVVKLTVGIPVAGTNVTPKAFDEKGMEVSESLSPRSSEGQSSTAVNERDHQQVSGASRLDVGVRFGLPTRRQNIVDQQHREVFERGGPPAQGRVVVNGAGASSSQVSEADERPGIGQIRRSLSSSSTVTCCDGTVSHLGAG